MKVVLDWKIINSLLVILKTQRGCLTWKLWKAVTYRGGVGLGEFKPPPEIPKALQNRAKLNPIVKTVKNCWI